MAGDGTGHLTLLDLLSNSLILSHIAPYLGLTSLYALGSTSHAFKSLVFESHNAFRYLDLSTVKYASGLTSAEDLTESDLQQHFGRSFVTEDDFYSDPLRQIFTRLTKKNILRDVQTLILDGLSVPADLIREIICDEPFNVRILSVREAENLNERKLMQVLKYAMRPSRPEGTPKLRALYIFGPKDQPPMSDKDDDAFTDSSANRQEAVSRNLRSSASPGIHIASSWNHRSQHALSSALSRSGNDWWQGSGRVIARPLPDWAEIVQLCEGVIAFDAILCRGPRHNPRSILRPEDQVDSRSTLPFLRPAIATIALGPEGCNNCHSSPEGAAIYGKSKPKELPLLAPPPFHSSSVRAAQMPPPHLAAGDVHLFARCEECLRERWCESCNKWWCESCYDGQPTVTLTILQQRELYEELLAAGASHSHSSEESIKGVKRDCWECGRTCATCIARTQRKCKSCTGGYCILHNEGSSATSCDWCSTTRPQTRDLY
ncbi:hypothetical protein L228DRAFT_247313 [Xylona heveae TC161]|uniref:F-box domain-containing protein n=1 Tax=Xylona heveae (strain CBS 132557 / TC161) TaxID=1328760 RepID=A0A165H2J8_XYLHT|nr:hypothetical protein L228DRAFT_247313 [Xylona heveae TC161]KZF22898.1 hypothetical protein L228DRAFT_247313 [Xylona heveae TC161]